MRYFSALPALALIACQDSAAPPSAEAMKAPSPPAPNAETLDFEKHAPGTAPAGFTAARTGEGRGGIWRVQRVAGAPSGTQVVAQVDADRTNSRFPVLVHDAMRAKDVDISVRFQPISGRVDQAAGLVWRYRDQNNYYVVRANALEDNVVLYKMENGNRRDLPVKAVKGNAYGVDADVPDQGWGTLRVTARGALFEVYFGERKLFEVEDSTFGEPGKVGLWTKADSVTRFDDFRIANLDSVEVPVR